MAQRRVASRLAVAVLVSVAALSVGVWWVVRRGVEQQNTALLKGDTDQIVLTFQEALQTESSAFADVGLVTVESGDSPAVFASVAKSFVAAPGASLAIVDDAVTPPRVVLAAGTNLYGGEQLSGALAQAVSKASPLLSSIPLIHIGTKVFLVVTEIPPATTGTVVLDMSEENPSKATSDVSGPYKDLALDVYATPSPQPGQLFSSNVGGRPLPKPTVSQEMKVGALEMDFVAAAQRPLVGGSAQAAPWIVLAVGLMVAISLATTVEVLVRRQRHTADVVAQTRSELLEAQGLLLRQERLSALGEMATVVGHELRNPLAAIVNSLYLQERALQDRDLDEAERHRDLAARQAARAANLGEDLTAYMRERSPSPAQISLPQVVEDVLEMDPPPPNVTVSHDLPVMDVVGDDRQLHQMMTNVVTNAYDAMADGGQLRITATRNNGTVFVTFEDEGPGFVPESIDKALEPFFTTKSTGTGLGLAIVQRLARANEGDVTIANRPTGGAIVTLRLPAPDS